MFSPGRSAPRNYDADTRGPWRRQKKKEIDSGAVLFKTPEIVAVDKTVAWEAAEFRERVQRIAAGPTLRPRGRGRQALGLRCEKLIAPGQRQQAAISTEDGESRSVFKFWRGVMRGLGCVKTDSSDH